MKVLVTGASGYIGRAVLRDLERAGHAPVPAVRHRDRLPSRWRSAAVEIGEIGPDTCWAAALAGVDAVVHLAAPAIAAGDTDGDARRVIVAGTDRLLAEAASVGAPRLVFLSSVKAVGEATAHGGVGESVVADPKDAYGQAKLTAEGRVMACGLDATVIRSPAVYARGSEGNVRQMIEFLRSAPPVLPLGFEGNRRSFVHRDNLTGAIIACVTHPRAVGRIFNVTDGAPESTAALTRRILRALDRRALVLPIPGAALRLLCSLRWGPEAARRLVDSYAFDDRAIRRELGWSPVLDPASAMADAVAPGRDPLLDAGPPVAPC